MYNKIRFEDWFEICCLLEAPSRENHSIAPFLQLQQNDQGASLTAKTSVYPMTDWYQKTEAFVTQQTETML